MKVRLDKKPYTDPPLHVLRVSQNGFELTLTLPPTIAPQRVEPLVIQLMQRLARWLPS